MIPLKPSAQCQMSKSVFVVVKHSPDFTHICNAIVIFGSQGEFTEVAELADPNGIEVPTDMAKRVQVGVVGVQNVDEIATHFWVTDPLKLLK